ncbi:MAG: serine acetyltransferase [Prolixibacteraceae bacterium]|jgi:serine O-acetyltransferase|nr:serine acetyltransferase [Prolixibacteraceae bacterium]
MSTINDTNIAEILRKAVDGLSNKGSYSSVCHEHRIGEPSVSVEKMGEIVNKVREILFPGYFGNTTLDPVAISYYMGVYTDELFELLSDQVLAGLCFTCSEQDDKDVDIVMHTQQARQIAAQFISKLPELRRILATDVEAAYIGDPAAKGKGEVIFCYPAIRAISSYRIANELVRLDVPLIPRIISEMAHSETGIDIHPKASIGESFTIDHGTGTVIGATCIIGNNVKLYQGVTLGAKSFPLDENGNPIKGVPRHPIIEDDVVIYAQATILGRITIGTGSIIGGNVWVTNTLPPNSKVVQFKARGLRFNDGAGI